MELVTLGKNVALEVAVQVIALSVICVIVARAYVEAGRKKINR